MDVLQLTQSILGNLFAADGVRAYWGQRGEIDQGAKADEYIIYSQDNDSIFESADGGTLARTASIAVRYYIDQHLRKTHAGRLLYTERVNAILAAMTEAGFLCPNGWMEIGDIDDVGFAVFLAAFDIARIVEL